MLYIANRWHKNTTNEINPAVIASIGHENMYGYTCEALDAIERSRCAKNAPTGIPNTDEDNNCKTLWNVQKFDISPTVNPIALKTVNCLFCSINAF